MSLAVFRLWKRISRIQELIEGRRPRSRGRASADTLLYLMLRREEKRLYMIIKRKALAENADARERWAQIVAQLDSECADRRAWNKEFPSKPDADM
jgi:hypothetical protein